MYISSFAHHISQSFQSCSKVAKLADQLHSNAVMLQRGSDGRDWFHLPKPQEWKKQLDFWWFSPFLFLAHRGWQTMSHQKREVPWLHERCCDMCCFRLLFWKSRAYWSSFVACTVCSGPVFVLFYLSLSKGVGVSVPLIYLRRGFELMHTILRVDSISLGSFL